MKTPVLSILVITHNQRPLLERCLESVLSQVLSVPFEVIISDDRSTDGTFKLVEEFRNRYLGNKKNLLALNYFPCNSDECHPTNTSERCGWNKLNAYLHAEGKYFVNIDADDYLRSDDIYQLQIHALEAHPECSMCMQRALSVKEGEALESGHAWPQSPLLRNGQVISAESFIQNDLRGVNPTYMIRRHPDDDMKRLYGKWFDDTIITYHHIQYGPVVFVDRSDYVWVQYPDSISHKMNKDDAILLYGLLPLHHATMIPSLKYLFLQYGLTDLIHMFKWAPEYPKLSQQYKDYWSNNDGFIYRYYTEDKHGILSRIRYIIVRYVLLIIKKARLKSSYWLDFVEYLLLSK